MASRHLSAELCGLEWSMSIGLAPGNLPLVLTSTEAQLYVADVRASCAYYVDKLSFSLAFILGRPAHYAQVVRDQARLNLRHVDEAVFAGDIREREQLLSATLTLDSGAKTRQLYADFEANGVAFSQTIRAESWGAITFVVKDPDGNLILFAGPAKE